MVGNEKIEEELRRRIKKDIEIFHTNVKPFAATSLGAEIDRIVRLSRMYASDSASYLEKGDLPTAFSCISYAHGLLDAVRDLNGKRLERPSG
jgi:hypothetical protein